MPIPRPVPAACLLMGLAQAAVAMAPLWTGRAEARDPRGEGIVKVDGAGNLYLFATAKGFAGERLKGNKDAWGLIKFDANGAKVWSRMWGESGWSPAAAAAIGPHGEIYLAGMMRGATLAKVDSAGNRKWAVYAKPGTEDGSEFRDVAVDPEGNVLAAGRTDMDSNDSQYVGRGILLSKFTPDGKPLWKRRLGDRDTEASGMAVDAQGGIYLVGSVNGDWEGRENHGGYDFFLLKCDSAGEPVWMRRYGTPGSDRGRQVLVDSAGDILSVGEFARVRRNPAKDEGSDTRLYKHDRNGRLVYDKTVERNLLLIQGASRSASDGPFALFSEAVGKRETPTGSWPRYRNFLVRIGPGGEEWRRFPIDWEGRYFGIGAVDSKGFLYVPDLVRDERRNSTEIVIAKFAAFAPSFECARAASLQDSLICGSEALCELDAALAQAYSEALKSASDPAAVKAGQAEWLRNERNLCATAGRLDACLRKRIEALAKGKHPPFSR